MMIYLEESLHTLSQKNLRNAHIINTSHIGTTAAF